MNQDHHTRPPTPPDGTANEPNSCGRGKTLALVVGVIGLGLVLGGLTFRPPPQPQLQGRTLASWALDLQSADREVYFHAVAALRTLGPDAAPPLVRVLQRRDPWHGPWVAALARQLPPRPARTLERWFRVGDTARHRAYAALALGTLGPDAATAVPALGRALQDPEFQVSAFAAAALGNIGKPSVPTLASALPTLQGDRQVRVIAALSQIGADAIEAIPAVVAVLRQPTTFDPAPHVAAALARMGPSCVPFLLGGLAAPEARVRETTAQTLLDLSRRDRSCYLALFRAYPQQPTPVRRELLRLLPEVPGDRRRVAQLMAQALSDADAEVRQRAETWLRAQGNPVPGQVPAEGIGAQSPES